MKLTLLGTGGPRPDPRRHGAAAVLQIGDEYLLFDAGRGVVLQLVAAGVPLERVSPIFLTHHHYDHIGDLADMILTHFRQKSDALMQEVAVEVAREYAGPVVLGRDLLEVLL
jgi:ribonuclease BN (tRNA processing enzyme)